MRSRAPTGSLSTRTSRERLKVFGPATVLVLLGFLVAYQFVEPAPPTTITIATGRQDGAYFAFAHEYQAILAERGITLNILSTTGSKENLALLGDPGAGVGVAFVQGGVGDPRSAPGLSALGSVYFEPLWVFHRGDVRVRDLSDLRGLRVSAGGVGSGNRAVALQLLSANGVDASSATIAGLGVAEAAGALIANDVDAAFLVVSVESPVIRDLLRRDDVRALSFSRSEAYTRVYPFLSALTLPRGVVDFAADIPPHDVRLVAPAATLVVREGFHPALIDLLLQAAADVHGGGGLLEAPGQFPSPWYIDYPIHKEARRYFRSGPPFLQRYLPFWAATLIDRIKVMLLPLLTLLIPLMKVVPPTYRWKVRSRIYRWYRELEQVDLAIGEGSGEGGLEACGAELDRIESDVTRVSVPLSYAVELYDLRLHIAHVREKFRIARERGAE